ncbi:hypothetical protein [Actinomadura xylanilytica]|uniref:hypothetical protein n=1 Tax=Actinomadura xylanilytica TaxID=887459 RepID=UPI00255AD52C|nr:hypothetical protein [Actinomadura xylanilytica]MDL4775564.1 hypothetical protein [Actinomadura xylanilytica]
MNDEPTRESVMATVESGRSADLRRVLKDLRGRGETGRAVEVPPPSQEWLENLDAVDDEIVVDLIELLHHYPRLVPLPTPEQVWGESLDAVLRFGSHYSAFHLALLARISPFPDETARDLLHRVHVLGEQELNAARWLVSYLLDGSETRPSAVRALEWMQEIEEFAPIVEFVRPQLVPAELAELDESHQEQPS